MSGVAELSGWRGEASPLVPMAAERGRSEALAAHTVYEMGTADGLTDLQRTLLDYITNAAEPTWIMVKEIPEARCDRRAIDAALEDLETRGLVDRTREPSGNPESGVLDLEEWWALTDHGWQVMGLPKPPGYR